MEIACAFFPLTSLFLLCVHVIHMLRQSELLQVLLQQISVAYLECCDFTELVNRDHALRQPLQLLFKASHLALQLCTLIQDAVDFRVNFQ